MQELELEDLKQIEGGFELSAISILALGFGIPFAIGVIDGLLNPSYGS